MRIEIFSSRMHHKVSKLRPTLFDRLQYRCFQERNAIIITYYIKYVKIMK